MRSICFACAQRPKALRSVSASRRVLIVLTTRDSAPAARTVKGSSVVYWDKERKRWSKVGC